MHLSNFDNMNELYCICRKSLQCMPSISDRLGLQLGTIQKVLKMVEGEGGGSQDPLKTVTKASRVEGGQYLSVTQGKNKKFLPLSNRNFNVFPIHSFKTALKYPNMIAVVSSCTYIVIILTFTNACLLLKVHRELLLDLLKFYISY